MSGLYGLVLAGGKSSRMGQDKALIEYGEKSQVETVWELLYSVCEHVYVSCRAGQLDGTTAASLPQLHDRIEGQGPIGGILRAFEQDSRSAWLVVACDLPLLSHEVLDRLLSSRVPGTIATAYRSGHVSQNGLPEPLCAIYEPAVIPYFEEKLAQDRRCPRKVLIEQEACVTLLDLPRSDALDNANHPEERDHYRERLSL